MNYLLYTVWCTLKPSPIHGIGVFAIRDIPKGTRAIWEYLSIEAVTLSEEEFISLPKAIQTEILHRVIFEVGQPICFLDPNCVTNYRSYMNHSSTPNTDGIYVLRDIKEGEELTEDYRTMGDWHPLTKAHMHNVV